MILNCLLRCHVSNIQGIFIFRFVSLRFCRMELGKENRDPLDRVMSAPPSLGHSRSNFDHHQMPRHRNEFRAPAGGEVCSYGRDSMNDNPRTAAQHVGGRASADSLVSGLLTSRYSLHSQCRDVSANKVDAGLRERRDQDFYAEPVGLSGRESNDFFYPSSYIDPERANSTFERFQPDSFHNGTRRTKPQLPSPEPHSTHSQTQGSFNRQPGGSDQRFSLCSEAQSRGEMSPGDDVMAFREHQGRYGDS